MTAGLDPTYREGFARALLGASLLLFAIFLGILFLAAAALGAAPGIFGGLALIASIPFGLIGVVLAADGYARMSRSQA